MLLAAACHFAPNCQHGPVLVSSPQECCEIAGLGGSWTLQWIPDFPCINNYKFWLVTHTSDTVYIIICMFIIMIIIIVCHHGLHKICMYKKCNSFLAYSVLLLLCLHTSLQLSRLSSATKQQLNREIKNSQFRI